MSTKDGIHNKSGLTVLSVLKADDTDIKKWSKILRKSLAVSKKSNECSFYDLSEASKCHILQAKDGRVSDGGKKVCFGYQLVAMDKFGKENLIKATPTKVEKEAYTISHLCGTRNCCISAHIVLEKKFLNDQRAHCHFAMSNLKKQGPPDDPFRHLRQFLEAGGCPHHPRCGTDDL